MTKLLEDVLTKVQVHLNFSHIRSFQKLYMRLVGDLHDFFELVDQEAVHAPPENIKDEFLLKFSKENTFVLQNSRKGKIIYRMA